MTGHINFTATDYGMTVDCSIENVSFMDKIMLLNTMMSALDIDMTDNNEVSMFCALAATVGNKAATKITVDKGMVNAIKQKIDQQTEPGEGQ